MREVKLTFARRAVARAIDIAARQEKCTFLLDELAPDAIDHRARNSGVLLAPSCPNGSTYIPRMSAMMFGRLGYHCSTSLRVCPSLVFIAQYVSGSTDAIWKDVIGVSLEAS